MAKDTSTFTLRLPTEQQAKVKELSEFFEVGEAQIIRWGVAALIKYIERHQGRLHLPIDFDTLWDAVKVSAPETVELVPGSQEAVAKSLRELGSKARKAERHPTAIAAEETVPYKAKAVS